jgi:hypothetical protein
MFLRGRDVPIRFQRFAKARAISLSTDRRFAPLATTLAAGSFRLLSLPPPPFQERPNRMPKRQRDHELLNERQRRTIITIADSHGIDAIAERFGFTTDDAKEAVRSCREWARSNKPPAPIDWNEEFEKWQAVG